MQATRQSIIKINNNYCQADFRSIERCCGSVRIEGWISAPDRSEGFQFSRLVAEAINKADNRGDLRSIGGFCMDETGPVHFPFSFDVQPGWHPKFLRSETLDETIERIARVLRKVRRAGVTPTGIA